MDKKELFESLPVPVALRKMIVPAAVSQIIVLIYNMADTFYIGRTNNPYMLAGASLILPVFNMLTCLASLAGIGGGTLLSNCVACAYFLVILWQIRLHTVLTADPRRGLPQRKNIAAVFGVGIPSAVASLLFDLDYVVIDKLMVSYSEVALAAIGIVLKVERLPLNVGIGICLWCRGLQLRFGCGSSALAGHRLVVPASCCTNCSPPGGSSSRCATGVAGRHLLRIRILGPMAGLRQRAHLAVPGRGAVAGVQHPHALPAEFPHRHVRHRLVPDHSRCADGAALGLCLPHPSSRLCGLTASYKPSRPEAAASGRGFLIFSRIRNRGCPVPPR